MDLATFKSNLLTNAYANGLSANNPFSIVVLSQYLGESGPIQKRITTSFTSPQRAHVAEPEELWLNSTNWTMYRLSPDGDTWLEVKSFEEIFVQDNTGLFQGNVATGPVYLPEAPQSDLEAVNKRYVDRAVASAVSSSPIAFPVETLYEVRNLDLNNLTDKRLIFVEETGKVYSYDAQATGQDDNGQTTITPTSEVGRWKTTINGILDGGSF